VDTTPLERRCGCAAPILWVFDLDGKRLALEPLPDPAGHYVFVGPGIVRRAERADGIGRQRFRPHHEACGIAHP
jgi:hypothetical protein